METPPPFAPPSPPPPRKKSNTALIIALILGAFGLCCVFSVGFMAYFGFGIFNRMSPFIGCAMGFEEAQKATQQFARAHGGNLPNAATWQDDIRADFAKIDKDFDAQKGPFKNLKTFPAQGEWLCLDEKGRKTGIAFNSELSGKNIDAIKDPYSTPMLFEVERTGTNLSEVYKDRPRKTSPTFMGTPRDWIVLYVKGSRNHNSGFNFDDSDSKDDKGSSAKSGKSPGDD